MNRVERYCTGGMFLGMNLRVQIIARFICGCAGLGIGYRHQPNFTSLMGLSQTGQGG